MATLSQSQRQAVQAHQGEPIAVVDDQTQRICYVISAEQFEQFPALLLAEPLDVRELYPLISKTAAEAGWAGPQMDDYDHYAEVRATTVPR